MEKLNGGTAGGGTNGEDVVGPPKGASAFHVQGSPDSVQQINKRLDAEYDLPITSSRTGTWASSAFHNVTAMVGAGVLGLPSAMTYLGWYGGIITLVMSWIISLYTLWQLCRLHEHNGKRFNRYHELGQHAFGEKWGLVIILIPQLIVMIGLGITYTVTGGQSMHAVYNLACEGRSCSPAGLSAWIVVFSAAQLILSQCPNFNSLTVVSLAAATMSLTYSTIAFAGSVVSGQQPGVEYNLDGFSLSDGIFGIFNALGTVAFAYGGHNVVLEIQATLPSPPKTLKPMMFGVYVAYGIVAWCYFSVSIAGYWAFGNAVKGNILLSIAHPKALIAAADMFVVIHVLGSYQVYTMPVFDMIETVLVRYNLPNAGLMRVFYRSVYVVIIGFVACCIPFFSDLMGFIGALGTGPTTFWLPCLIWLVVQRPSVRDPHFWASWGILILCIIVTIVGAMGGLYGIVQDAKTYRFFQ